MAVDWNTPKYKKALGGSLEYWQYLAACYISCTEDTIEQRDADALNIGALCHEKTEAGTPTCLWHESHLFYGSPGPCPCVTCSQRKESNPWPAPPTKLSTPAKTASPSS